jgi:N-acetylmuramoyl-L-alanine amidase
MPRTTLLRTVSAAAALAVVGGLMLVGQAGFGAATAPRAVKVSWGDTLWALSRRYGVTVAQLASANHMRPTDTLYAGRTLYLPSGTGGAGGTGSAAAPAKTGAPAAVSSSGATAASALQAAQEAERTFCTTYRPPTGPRGQLPSSLAADPSRMALRPLFAKWASVYGVPADLIEGEAWQESGWSNSVVSPAGAVGIGQLLPATAAFVNQSLGTNLQLNVASDNIEMMAAFLSYLLRATGGQVCGAVASYYEGLGNLDAYGVLPVTQTYVEDVLSLRPRFD